MTTQHANYQQDISERLHETSTYSNTVHTGSAKYSIVNTGAIVEFIKANTDYVPVTYTQNGTRRKVEGTQAHLIRMRSRADLATPKPLMPELILLNSYDTSKAFKVYLGAFRIACLNGLIAGDTMGKFSQKHINFDYDALGNFLCTIDEKTSLFLDKAKQWDSIKLDVDQLKEFGLKTLIARDYDKRYTKGDGFYANWANNDVQRLLRPKRIDDASRTLWQTYNLLQEKAIGGAQLLSGKLRAIKSPTEQVRINREIFDIASQYEVTL